MISDVVVVVVVVDDIVVDEEGEDSFIFLLSFVFVVWMVGKLSFVLLVLVVVVVLLLVLGDLELFDFLVRLLIDGVGERRTDEQFVVVVFCCSVVVMLLGWLWLVDFKTLGIELDGDNRVEDKEETLLSVITGDIVCSGNSTGVAVVVTTILVVVLL